MIFRKTFISILVAFFCSIFIYLLLFLWIIHCEEKKEPNFRFMMRDIYLNLHSLLFKFLSILFIFLHDISWATTWKSQPIFMSNSNEFFFYFPSNYFHLRSYLVVCFRGKSSKISTISAGYCLRPMRVSSSYYENNSPNPFSASENQNSRTDISLCVRNLRHIFVRNLSKLKFILVRVRM